MIVGLAKRKFPGLRLVLFLPYLLDLSAKESLFNRKSLLVRSWKKNIKIVFKHILKIRPILLAPYHHIVDKQLSMWQGVGEETTGKCSWEFVKQKLKKQRCPCVKKIRNLEQQLHPFTNKKGRRQHNDGHQNHVVRSPKYIFIDTWL